MLRTRRHRAGSIAAILALVLTATALAHFQELLPGSDVVTRQTGPTVELSLVFTHPLAGGPVMPMERPAAFGVRVDGVTIDLADALESVTVDGQPAYRAGYELDRPGDHLFFVEPAPYYEPAEGKAIVHYAKVVVNGYGMSEGWDEPVGLPVEILPLVRPYDLWEGNLFRGVVLRGGEPVPFAEVEVAWRNDGTLDAERLTFATQVIKADATGAFAFAMPRAGWWGFAALVEGDEPIVGPDGEAWDVELGGLVWVHARSVE